MAKPTETKPTVLIVDDDPSIRKMLQEVLSLEGYPLETAKNGQEALDALERGNPRIVLLDLLMPVLSGPEVMAALNANGVRERYKVVFVSAIHNLAEHRSLGPDAELAKPFTLDQLMSVLEQQAA